MFHLIVRWIFNIISFPYFPAFFTKFLLIYFIYIFFVKSWHPNIQEIGFKPKRCEAGDKTEIELWVTKGYQKYSSILGWKALDKSSKVFFSSLVEAAIQNELKNLSSQKSTARQKFRLTLSLKILILQNYFLSKLQYVLWKLYLSHPVGSDVWCPLGNEYKNVDV